MVETLAADWYVDEAIFRRERRAIFARNWCLFGPEAEFAEPGAFRAERINGWPVVVVRGKDRALRGFHNVCRHRAAAPFASGPGRCEVIRCPYHGWTYDSAGALVAAPNFGDDPGFDKAAYGLFPVRVEVWRGLVFFCIDAATPDLMTWLGAIPALCEPYPGPAEREYYGSFIVEGAANWKTYCDNTVEGYHLPFIHPRLFRAVVPDKVDLRAYDGGRCVAFQVTYRDDGAGLRGRDGLWFYRFPGFQATLSATALKAERIEPLGARGLKSASWQWFNGIPDEGRRDAFQWARTIVEEDVGICETVQQNLEAGVYRSGRLSPKQEGMVALFQALVRAAVTDE